MDPVHSNVFDLQVSGDYVTLYLDCMEYATERFARAHTTTLPFDPQSTIYVGSAGDIIGQKYEVRFTFRVR